MKRGEIWTLRDKQYASKSRPVIVIQSDAQSGFDSVILCLFTTYNSENCFKSITYNTRSLSI